MKRFTKFLLLALVLMALPSKQWAQTPYRQYSEDGVLLNAFEIDNVDFRAFLFYNLNQDERFEILVNEEPGQFSIIPGHHGNVVNLFDAFESAYQRANTDFGFLSKMDIYDYMPTWKSNIPSKQFASLMMDIALRNSRPSNNHCADSDPFCTSDLITFDAATSSETADQLEGTTINDGCIGSSYNPSWYHMRINDPGQFIIHMEGHDPTTPTTQRDIDFCIWGPFTDPTSACVAGLLTSNIIDCCFSASYSENIYLGYPEGEHVHNTGHGTVNYHVPQTGEYYILMITNFSRQPCTISFTKTENSGPGTTDCGILPGIVSNSGPYCVGETIQLTVNQQVGATYSWTGPGGFTSNQLTPSRPNCTMAMAGTYTCVTTVGNETTTASTEVVIYPQPTANFNAPSVCVGSPTQFTSTSTTNPSGQSIGSYQWNFGDGQTGSGQSTTHTYAAAGTYQATLTVSTGNGHCTDDITQTVTVNPAPTASFTATTVCQGNPTQFTSTSTGQSINSYQWNFGDNQTGTGQNATHTYAQAGTFNVTLTVQSAGGCTDQITQTVTVNPSPTASFNATTVCQGNPTQFTSTSTGQGIDSYQWNFGDNQTGTGQNATHTYAQAGTYHVTLTVQSAGGCSDQTTQTVTVNALPTASFNATTVCQGQATQFTSTSTGQGVNSYQWNFGDNQTGTGQNATHTYAQAGTYQVTLTVQTAGGCSDQITQTVTVNALPTAAFNATTVCQGQATQFTSTSGQGVNSFQWNFGDNQTGTGQNASHTYAQAGTYQVTLTVQTASGCSDQITQTVTVNALPTAAFDATTVCQGEATQFTSTST